MDSNYDGSMPNDPFADQLQRDRMPKRDRTYLRGAAQPISLALDAANNQFMIEFAGDFIYFDRTTTGQVNVHFDMAMQRGIPCAANAFFPRIEYDRQQVKLSWAAQPGKIAVVWVGYGVSIVPPNQDIATIGSITNPVTIASITTPVPLDPEYAKYFLFGDDEIDDGEAFIGLTRPGPVAASFSQSQLKNPAASGKNVYVDRCTCQSIGGASFARLSLNDTDLATLTGAIQSKQGIGGAASIAQIRQDSNGAIFGTQISLRGVESNQSVQWEFKPPFRLTPTHGISVSSEVVNLEFDTTWEWRERP